MFKFHSRRIGRQTDAPKTLKRTSEGGAGPCGLPPVHWVQPWWAQRQRDPDSSAFTPGAARRPAVARQSRRTSGCDANTTGRTWTLVGLPEGRHRVPVDPVGLVVFGAWSLDWWVRADDRWVFASTASGVRQRLIGAMPAVETSVRVGGGDVRHRVTAAKGNAIGADRGVEAVEAVVVEIENATSGPIAVALAVRPYGLCAQAHGSTDASAGVGADTAEAAQRIVGIEVGAAHMSVQVGDDGGNAGADTSRSAADLLAFDRRPGDVVSASGGDDAAAVLIGANAPARLHRARQDGTEPDTAGPDRTEPDTAEQRKTEPGEPDKTEPDKTASCNANASRQPGEPDKTEPDKTRGLGARRHRRPGEPDRTEPDTAEQRKTEPGETASGRDAPVPCQATLAVTAAPDGRRHIGRVPLATGRAFADTAPGSDASTGAAHRGGEAGSDARVGSGSAPGNGDTNAAAVFSLVAGSTLRAAVLLHSDASDPATALRGGDAGALVASLPSVDQAARGWQLRTDARCRIELPSGRLADTAAAAKAAMTFGARGMAGGQRPDGGSDASAMEHWPSAYLDESEGDDAVLLCGLIETGAAGVVRDLLLTRAARQRMSGEVRSSSGHTVTHTTLIVAAHLLSLDPDPALAQALSELAADGAQHLLADTTRYPWTQAPCTTREGLRAAYRLLVHAGHDRAAAQLRNAAMTLAEPMRLDPQAPVDPRAWHHGGPTVRVFADADRLDGRRPSELTGSARRLLWAHAAVPWAPTPAWMTPARVQTAHEQDAADGCSSAIGSADIHRQETRERREPQETRDPREPQKPRETLEQREGRETREPLNAANGARVQDLLLGDFSTPLGYDLLGTALAAFAEARVAPARSFARLEALASMASQTCNWPTWMHPRLRTGTGGAGHDLRVGALFVRTLLRLLVDVPDDGAASSCCAVGENRPVNENRPVGGGNSATSATNSSTRTAQRPELRIAAHWPTAWLGQAVELHDVPTRIGAASWAVRWHGERPALLWEIDPHDLHDPSATTPTVTAPGLDPAFAANGWRGEALLAPSA